MNNIEKGKYRHFKGGEYEVLGLGKNSETEEDTVIYKSIATGETWLRPASMWTETIKRDGCEGPRFVKIDDNASLKQTSSRRELAMEYFKQGYNCTQAVIAAYSDIINIEFDTAMKLGASFGGGMGRLREVCGAVSGMFAVVGAIKGYSDPKDIDGKKEHYALIQSMATDFKEQNGSIICRELLGLDTKTPDNPTPAARTDEYYKKRPCGELVGIAAEIAEKALGLH